MFRKEVQDAFKNNSTLVFIESIAKDSILEQIFQSVHEHSLSLREDFDFHKKQISEIKTPAIDSEVFLCLLELFSMNRELETRDFGINNAIYYSYIIDRSKQVFKVTSGCETSGLFFNVYGKLISYLLKNKGYDFFCKRKGSESSFYCSIFTLCKEWIRKDDNVFLLNEGADICSELIYNYGVCYLVM